MKAAVEWRAEGGLLPEFLGRLQEEGVPVTHIRRQGDALLGTVAAVRAFSFFHSLGAATRINASMALYSRFCMVMPCAVSVFFTSLACPAVSLVLHRLSFRLRSLRLGTGPYFVVRTASARSSSTTPVSSSHTASSSSRSNLG